MDPIRWRIISENNDDSYQLYSEYILDAMSYCQLFDVRNVDGEEIYVNNYKYSNVRAWLNGYDGTGYEMPDYSNIGFYNLAFSEEEKEKIIIHEVDNSLSTTNSTSNDFLSENTIDNIYLLSANDLENSNYGFTSYESRCAKVTDYAKAVGAYWYNSSTYKDQGYYWLRSPYGSSGNLAFYVYNDGGINSFATLYEICGIRAACTIKS